MKKIQNYLLIGVFVMTALLAAVYFGARSLRKSGISPIALIVLSAVSGIVLWGV